MQARKRKDVEQSTGKSTSTSHSGGLQANEKVRKNPAQHSGTPSRATHPKQAAQARSEDLTSAQRSMATAWVHQSESIRWPQWRARNRNPLDRRGSPVPSLARWRPGSCSGHIHLRSRSAANNAVPRFQLQPRRGGESVQCGGLVTMSLCSLVAAAPGPVIDKATCSELQAADKHAIAQHSYEPQTGCPTRLCAPRLLGWRLLVLRSWTIHSLIASLCSLASTTVTWRWLATPFALVDRRFSRHPGSAAAVHA
ncbi:hypothetical protein SVAN01_09521 [Stagonosporopsis vannaccii]|nr:hypothetical protein SVAN01_09521 [Stagonosporopsis vannaccii]